MKECNQCGKCCTKYGDGGLSVSESEIESWEVFRPDLVPYIKKGEIWFDPNSRLQLTQCPWLQKLPDQNKHGKTKYGCKIYLDRPNDCRYYPVTIDDMIFDECEMLEVKDLTNQKEAQRTLDKIMIDSRPPYIRK